MDVPTYPRFQRPTVDGLVVTGRLAPRRLPKLGRHSEEHLNPQAVSVAALLGKDVASPTVAWFDEQLAAADTVRLPRIVEPLGGAA